MRLVGLVLTGLKIIGLLIHLWTLFIVYSIYGLLGTLIAFFMPILAQIYLFFVSWGISGTIFTKYNTILLVYVIGFIVWWILVFAVKPSVDRDIF